MTKRLDERSYDVATADGQYRRNRVHLLQSMEQPPITLTVDDHDDVAATPDATTEYGDTSRHSVAAPYEIAPQQDAMTTRTTNPVPSNSERAPYVTRSGRTVNKSSRFAE